MEKNELRKMGIFAKIKPESLEKITSIARGEKFKAGENIFSEGNPGDCLYLIIEGEVRISKIVSGVGEEALAVLEPGNCFGEMSLIDGRPRSADAKAHSSCRLVRITRDDFHRLLKEDKEVAAEILWELLRTMSVRLRETNEKIKTFFILSGLF